jgi:hypothetical protein
MDFPLQVQSVPITTNAMNSNPAHGKVYPIQLYMIHVFSDLRQDDGFLRVHNNGPLIPIDEHMMWNAYLTWWYGSCERVHAIIKHEHYNTIYGLAYFKQPLTLR